MAKPKVRTDIVLLVLCILFILASLVLFAGNRTLATQLKSHKAQLMASSLSSRQKVQDLTDELNKQRIVATSLQNQLKQAESKILTLEQEKSDILEKLDEIKAQATVSEPVE